MPIAFRIVKAQGAGLDGTNFVLPRLASGDRPVYRLLVEFLNLFNERSLTSPRGADSPSESPSALPIAPTSSAEVPGLHVTQGDAVEWLNRLPAESVDLAITDPPYESLEKHRAIGTTTRLSHSKSSSNDWFRIFPNARFPELFEALYRVLSKNSHLYLFCDQETMFVAKPIAQSVGFHFWKPLVWDKKTIGMGYHYRARYEFILFFEKGKRKLQNLSMADVIECPRIVRGYPTEKPVAVSEMLIAQSSSPGERVIDPFAGSGSVGVAALNLGRSFRGNDISAQAVSLANPRLSAVARSRNAPGSEPALG